MEGRLAPADAAAVEVRCRRAGAATLEQVEWVSWFLGNARQVPLTAPPPLVTQRLCRLADQRRRPPVPPRRLDAELVVDTRGTDQLVRVRRRFSPATSDTS